MIPGTIFDIFQPMNDFFYGLDVEIRPKLTPGAGTQVQYSTALWQPSCKCRGQSLHVARKLDAKRRYVIRAKALRTLGHMSPS